MDKKSSAQKVIKVDKRLLNEERKSTFAGSSIYILWGGIAGVALLAAAASFLTADLDKIRANNSNPQVDTITTAGVSSSARPINVAQRRKQVLATQVQKQKIDDISRVIHRLRGEQISLNNRIAELETKIRETQTRTKTLENELKKAPVQSRVSSSVPQQAAPASSANLNPEFKANDEWQTQTVRVIPPNTTPEKTTKTKIKQSVPPAPRVQTKSAGTSVFTKTKSGNKRDVDTTVVGSINLAETTKFAIDLGVNPTEARAKDLWESLKKNKSSALAQLTPNYIPTGNNEGETRIVAGPFLDASDAIKACVAVRAVQAFCKTALFPK